MLAVIFALVSLFSWGFGDVFITFGSRKFGSYNSTFYSYIAGCFVASAFIPFVLHDFVNLNLGVIILTILLTISEIIGFLSYNEALRIGNSSLVGTISGAFTSLVVILSLVFLGEKISQFQLASIIVIFSGLLLSSLNFADLTNKKRIINKGNMLALVAMISWAIYFTFIKIPVKESGFFWPSYVSVIAGSAIMLIFGLRRIKKPKLGLRNGIPAVLIAGTLSTIGTFSFSFGIEKGLSSIVAPIAGAYPALFALLAFFIFKDPTTKQQKLGMIVTLVGIIFLAYLSK